MNLTELKDVSSKNERVWVIFGEWNEVKGSTLRSNFEIGNWLYSRYGLGERFAGKIYVYLIQPSKTVVLCFQEQNFYEYLFHGMYWSLHFRYDI